MELEAHAEETTEVWRKEKKNDQGEASGISVPLWFVSGAGVVLVEKRQLCNKL